VADYEVVGYDVLYIGAQALKSGVGTRPRF
jgi:hypothetical protein